MNFEFCCTLDSAVLIISDQCKALNNVTKNMLTLVFASFCAASKFDESSCRSCQSHECQHYRHLRGFQVHRCVKRPMNIEITYVVKVTKPSVDRMHGVANQSPVFRHSCRHKSFNWDSILTLASSSSMFADAVSLVEVYLYQLSFSPHPRSLGLRHLSSLFYHVVERRFLPESQFCARSKRQKQRRVSPENVWSVKTTASAIGRRHFRCVHKLFWLPPNKVSEVLCLTHSDISHRNATQHEITQNARLAERNTENNEKPSLAARKSSHSLLPLHGNDIKVLWFI